MAQVKYANYPNAHAQTFVLLNGEMATVFTCFRMLKFRTWLLCACAGLYMKQTGFLKDLLD